MSNETLDSGRDLKKWSATEVFHVEHSMTYNDLPPFINSWQELRCNAPLFLTVDANLWRLFPLYGARRVLHALLGYSFRT